MIRKFIILIMTLTCIKLFDYLLKEEYIHDYIINKNDGQLN